MKTVILLFLFLIVCAWNLAQAAEKSLHRQTCVDLDLKSSLKAIWFVPIGGTRAYFSETEDGERSQRYVIAGDLLVAGKESSKSILACYLKNGKTVASGWIKKSELVKFENVRFGSFDVEESQKKIEDSYKALVALSKQLPEPQSWVGTWKDSSSNEVTIKRISSKLRLNTMGIKGAVGTGDENEDSRNLSIKGSLGEVREDLKKIEVCDIVIVSFNNALLATSGSHCMGSGADHEYPEFSGIYWKKK